jgi:hypothetical protein
MLYHTLKHKQYAFYIGKDANFGKKYDKFVLVNDFFI